MAKTLTNLFVAASVREPTRRWSAPSLLRGWHLASLDAPTVAATWALGFSWSARVQLPVWVPCLLALGAWALYVFDRLLDARTAFKKNNSTAETLRERHFFHWHHRRILLPLALLGLIVAAFVAAHSMPLVARVRNTALAALAMTYFIGVHSNRLRLLQVRPSRLPRLPRMKELLVALIFTSACILPTFTRATNPVQLIWPGLIFAALAWLNCHAIEWWESNNCSKASAVLLPSLLLASVSCIAALLVAPINSRSAMLLVAAAVSALFLGVVDRLRDSLTPLAVRVAADLVLLTPLLLLVARG